MNFEKESKENNSEAFTKGLSLGRSHGMDRERAMRSGGIAGVEQTYKEAIEKATAEMSEEEKADFEKGMNEGRGQGHQYEGGWQGAQKDKKG